jgi:hypothetical protein
MPWIICVLSRGQEYGPLFVIFFIHRSVIIPLKPSDIKVIHVIIYVRRERPGGDRIIKT